MEPGRAQRTDGCAESRTKIRAFDFGEARRFVGVVSCMRLEALYLLAVTLGLRRGEYWRSNGQTSTSMKAACASEPRFNV